MYQLYYYPSNANLAPHMLLEEIGAPYKLVYVDRDQGAHKKPEYLKLNPSGTIPVLIDEELSLTIPETAAICLHLADRHPEAGLIPPLGSKERAELYRWLIYLTNTVQATLIHYYYPDRLGQEHQETVKARAEVQLMDMLDILEAQMQKSGGPWLLGARYSVADPFLMMMCRWTRNMAHPARARPALARFLAAMAERPAVIRAHQGEALTLPWF